MTNTDNIKETIVIPEGCYAEIEDGKVIIKKILSDDERIYMEILSFLQSGIWSPKEIDGVRRSRKNVVWVEWMKGKINCFQS